jgi:predicted GNAT family acetyltransferase
MDVRGYSEANDFLVAAGSLLQSDEVRYGLIYGIARRVAANPHHYGEEDPWFLILADKAGISALAWRTPPYLVGLAWCTGDPEGAASVLVESVRNQWEVIPGVTGHREVTDLFAQKWSTALGTTIQSTQSQRIYRLDSVINVPGPSGRMRLATLLDKELILDWTRAFAVDTDQEFERGISERIDSLDKLTTQRIEKSEVYLWEDTGRPVSMAAKNRPTDHGMAVGLVYTPPPLRRKGYATACVAAVCKEILKGGYDFCTLYTDLGNPISNSIYMKIGFCPVCDSVQYTFSNAIR